MILSFQDHANLVFERKLREGIVHHGNLFSQMLIAALHRQPLKGYKSFKLNGEEVSCDFSDHGNILKFDDIGIPFIKRLLVAAQKEEMTGITGLFDSPPMRYALDHGTRGKSYVEIVQLLSQNDPGLRLV